MAAVDIFQMCSYGERVGGINLFISIKNNFLVLKLCEKSLKSVCWQANFGCFWTNGRYRMILNSNFGYIDTSLCLESQYDLKVANKVTGSIY